VIDAYRRHLDEEEARPGPRQRGNREKSAPTRLSALRALYGASAARMPKVISFRQRHLGGVLLSRDAVADWLKSQEAPGPELIEIEVGLNVKESNLNDNRAGVELPADAYPVVRRRRNQLVWMKKRYALGSQVLRELDQIAKNISSTFSWEIESAVGFLLCGLIPPPMLLSASSRPGIQSVPSPFPRLLVQSESRNRHDEGVDEFFISSTFIDFRVHLSVTPEQLKKEFHMLRALYLEMHTGRTTAKQKGIGEKHLGLARHAANNGLGNESMAAWNKSNKDRPEWGYKSVSSFNRDIRSTTLSLMQVAEDTEDALRLVLRKKTRPVA